MSTLTEIGGGVTVFSYGPPPLVRAYSFGRLSIKKHSDHRLFVISVADDGTITLTPAQIVPINALGGT